ncbi:MAG: tetratricopeptide repeat protein [Moraxellaceae bacterium]
MRIKKTLALCSLAVAISLAAGCASTPKQPSTDTPTAPDQAAAEAAEPDLVQQLRERMAAGTLQRQEKAEDRKPVEISGDTSQSPASGPIDAARQQAAMTVAADYAKAMSLMAGNRDDDALALLRQIEKKVPQLSGPVVNQGVILLRQKQHAAAETEIRRALAINAKSPYAHNLLGIALREQGKFAEARTAYEAALAIDPNYAKAHFNLGVLADLYQHDLPRALTHYERYQTLQSKPDPAVANWIVDLQKRTGTYVPPARPAKPPVVETQEDPLPEEAPAEPPAAEPAASDVPPPEAAAAASEKTP